VAIPFTYPSFRPPAADRKYPAELLTTIRDVAGALAAPTVVEPSWRATVSRRLAAVRRAFDEHIAVTEGPEGLYAEILDCEPRLARRIHLLTREHDAISAAIDLGCVRIAGSSREEIRAWAGELLSYLHHHRQRGADLLYEALETDIGGET
jgi:hypothetical protein